MSGVFLLISGLLFSKGLTNTPGGDTAKMIFAFGLVVYALFTFFFMLYINNFHISTMVLLLYIKGFHLPG